jgi:hypothetical protein
VLPSEFQAQFPDGEFSALTGDYVQKFLNAATPFFDVGRWGSWYSEGFACYVAHSIIVSKARAARGITQMNGGNTTEKHVGAVGTSFDSQILNKQLLDTFLLTDYGRRYCELRDMVGLGGTIAAGGFTAADGLDEVIW